MALSMMGRKMRGQPWRIWVMGRETTHCGTSADRLAADVVVVQSSCPGTEVEVMTPDKGPGSPDGGVS